MGNGTIPRAGDISKEEFAQYLARYDSTIESISAAKETKQGEKSLAELDQYRYGEYPTVFGSQGPRVMGLDDVKTLVSWKLRHGKFRPTLMKLVSSNDPVLVENTVREAMSAYEEHDAAAALKIFTKLKGIGPATASLLLAVHDPKRVIFFADEAFYWLCCDGRKDPIKYNAKEYEALSENALALCQRLGVAAVDVERVAFVLLRQGGSPDLRSPAQSAVDKDPRQGKKAEVKSNTTVEKPRGRAAKRKAAPSRGAKPELNTSLRRSKRRTSPNL